MQNIGSTTVLLLALLKLLWSWQAATQDLYQEGLVWRQKLQSEYDLRLCLGVKTTQRNLVSARDYLLDRYPQQAAAITEEAERLSEDFGAAFGVSDDPSDWSSEGACFAASLAVDGYLYQEHTPGRPAVWPNWRFRWRQRTSAGGG